MPIAQPTELQRTINREWYVFLILITSSGILTAAEFAISSIVLDSRSRRTIDPGYLLFGVGWSDGHVMLMALWLAWGTGSPAWRFALVLTVSVARHCLICWGGGGVWEWILRAAPECFIILAANMLLTPFRRSLIATDADREPALPQKMSWTIKDLAVLSVYVAAPLAMVPILRAVREENALAWITWLVRHGEALAISAASFYLVFGRHRFLYRFAALLAIVYAVGLVRYTLLRSVDIDSTVTGIIYTVAGTLLVVLLGSAVLRNACDSCRAPMPPALRSEPT